MSQQIEKVVYPKDIDWHRYRGKIASLEDQEKFTSSPPNIFTVMQDCNQGGEYLRLYWPVDQNQLDGKWFEWVPWDWESVIPEKINLKDITDGFIVNMGDRRYSATVQGDYCVRFNEIPTPADHFKV